MSETREQPRYYLRGINRPVIDLGWLPILKSGSRKKYGDTFNFYVRKPLLNVVKQVDVEKSPPLTAQQIGNIKTKITPFPRKSLEDVSVEGISYVGSHRNGLLVLLLDDERVMEEHKKGMEALKLTDEEPYVASIVLGRVALPVAIARNNLGAAFPNLIPSVVQLGSLGTPSEA